MNGNESDAPQITTAEDWQIGFEPDRPITQPLLQNADRITA